MFQSKMFKSRLFPGTRWEICVRSLQAEFLAMLLFVFVGCGTAVFFSAPPEFDFNRATILVSPITGSFGITTALAFGFGISCLIFVFGPVSGGHINCTVSWCLYWSNQLSLGQLVGNTVVQWLGSLCGAALLLAVVPGDGRLSKLGANGLAPGAVWYQALIGEMIMTFLLCLTVLMTTSSRENHRVFIGVLAPFAIGLSVFLAHAVLIPLDGCSINPSRSFGPAVVAGQWSDFWIFVVGPYLGSSLAALVYASFHYGGEFEKNDLEAARSKSELLKSYSAQTLNEASSV